MPTDAVPVDAIYFGIVGFDDCNWERPFPDIPHIDLPPMSRGENLDVSEGAIPKKQHTVIVLSIPFALRARCTPCAYSQDRSIIAHSQIPASHSTVHPRGRHEVRVPSMPIDICDCPCMCVDRPVQRGCG